MLPMAGIASAQEEAPPESTTTGWFDMEFDPASGTHKIDWEAPPTAEPEGLIGGIFMRVLDEENVVSSELVQFDAGFAVDPNGREFGFQDDASGARLRGVVVIEPADAVNAQVATENVIGIAFGGSNLTDGAEYTLTIAAPDGGPTRTVSFTAGGGGGELLIGPEETDFLDNETEFTYTVNGPEFDGVSVGPPYAPEFEAEPSEGNVVTAANGTTLTVVQPTVGLVGGAPEIELLGSSVARGPILYTFEAEVTDAAGNVLNGEQVDVEWQLIVSGEVQTPGPRLLPEEITISADGAPASYSIEMGRDSRIQATDTLEAGDAVSADGTSASGTVEVGDSDTYRFLGSIFDFDVSGPVTVTVNGQPADLATLNADEIQIRGTGTVARYQFLVEGENAEVRPANGLSSEDSISADGTSVEGAVRAGRDTYRFNGSVAGFTPTDGSVNVFINGTQVDPTTISNLPNEIVVQGVGELANYQFESSGRLQFGGGISQEDTITGSTAIGAVRGGRDVYRFSGEIVNFLNDGSVRVFVNGVDRTLELTNPADRITIDGLGEFTSYDFAVTGEIEPTRRLTVEDSISPDAKSASGAVRAGTDAYMISGDITTLTLDSRARVTINDSEKTITIAGEGPLARYQVSVTGSLRRTSALTAEDSISADGTTATGAVRRGFDTYIYTGAIESITINGAVALSVER